MMLKILGVLAAITALMFLAMIIVGKKREASDAAGGGKTAQSPKVKVDKMRLPYRYQHDELFVYDKAVWMGVKIPPHASEHLSDEDAERYCLRATQAINALSGNRGHAEVQYRVTSLPLDVDDWAEQLIEHAWNPTQMYCDYVEAQRQYLRAAGASSTTPILLMKLGELDKKTLDAVAEAVDSMIIGEHDDGLPPNVAAEWSSKASQVMRALQPLKDDGGELVPLTRYDLMWLIRKPLTGHFDPDLSDFPETKAWGEGEFARWIDFHADNERDHLAVKLLNADVVPYQRDDQADRLESKTACLLLTDWPQKADSEREHGMFEWLGAVGEVSYRMWVMSSKELEARLTAVKNNIEGEITSFLKPRPEGTQIDQLLQDEFLDAEAALNAARRSPDVRGAEYQLVVQLSAPTELQLGALCEKVANGFKQNYGGTLQRVRRHQLHLLRAMLPGSATPEAVSIGRRLGEPNHWALGHPRTGVNLGSRVERGTGGRTQGWLGDYIGLSDDSPIFDSPHANLDRQQGAGVLIVGSTGGGKTNFAVLKFFQDTESGVEGYAIDPKNDFAAFVYYLAFGPQVNEDGFEEEATNGTLGTADSKFQPVNRIWWEDTLVVDLLRSRAGLLDAWQMTGGDLDEGALVARETFQLYLATDIYDLTKVQLTTSIAELVAECSRSRDTYRRENPEATENDAIKAIPLPSMWKVVQRSIDKLGEITKDARTTIVEAQQYSYAASELENLCKAPAARVVFAESPQGLRLGGYRRTVFTLMGIARPGEKAPHRWTESERYGAGAIYLLTRLVARRMNGGMQRHRTTGLPTNPPRAAWVDESYVVSSFEAGRAFLQVALAQGRSLNFVLYLLDQNASRVAKIESSSGEDDGESSGNQLQTIYAFRQRKGQNMHVARMMTTTNVQQIATTVLAESDGGRNRTGRCLMKDADNQLGIVDVDLMFRPLLYAADTNPSSKAKSWSHPVAASPLEWAYLSSEERDDALDRGELAALEAEVEAEVSSATEEVELAQNAVEDFIHTTAPSEEEDEPAESELAAASAQEDH